MLTKIISGGQTGADRAALDVAIELDIPHGGWIRKGRKTEDGDLHGETASMVIIEALWEKLRQTHTLRAVK